ncbi:hypothetical protein BKI52_20725 [marine bacterium AO1-C]|nr:hypothetical protein BKI52_20725 [marine bacterium AO1-C]
MKYLSALLLLLLTVGCKKKRPNVQVIPIQQKWIKAKLFKKYWIGSDTTSAKKTILITLSGFEGGHLPEKSLRALANQGYDILSLAYSAPPPGLPNAFVEIPIEYLAKAVNWLKNQNKYKKHKIVLLGVSKGAELALLYGSYYQNIDGIIAYSPSYVLLPALSSSKSSRPNRSPWSYQYKPLPFIPVKKVDVNTKTVIYKDYIAPWLSDMKVFKQARIPVERINCPMLLLAGQNDQMWDAAKMSQLIQYKMEASFKPHKITQVVFKNAGHRFFGFGEALPEYTSTAWEKKLDNQSLRFMLGGTKEGNHKAMVEGQKQVMKFLYKIENPPSIDSLDSKFRNLNQ